MSGRISRIVSQLSELTREARSLDGMENARRNQGVVQNGKSILELGDTPLVNSDHALVIAAAPSLHRVNAAKLIQDSRFDGAIIVPEFTLPWCLRNGVVPDLTLTLDPHKTRVVRWFGDPNLTKNDIAADNYYERQEFDPWFHGDQMTINAELLKLVDRFAPKIKIAVCTSASERLVKRVHSAGFEVFWWNAMYDDYDQGNSVTRELYDLNCLPCINAGGNVTTAAWVFAHSVLEKVRIGLLGVDFSYEADSDLKKTQCYPELVDLVGADKVDTMFERVFNPHINSEYLADPTYLWYRDIFLDMAAEAAEHGVKTVNCSGGGILYGANIHWQELDQFLAGNGGG